MDFWSLCIVLFIGLGLGSQLVVFALWASDAWARRQRHARKLAKLRDSVPPVPVPPPALPLEQYQHAYVAVVSATVVAQRLAAELGAQQGA